MIKSTEVVIECPECDNTSLKGRYDPNCYVNLDKGVWQCQRCKAKGRIDQLDPAALENPVETVEKKEQLDTSVIQSFIPLQTYEERFPGVKLPPGILYLTADKSSLAIVGRDWGNKIVSIKYRTIRGEKSYIAEPGSEIGKFFLPLDKELETKERKVLIVEGEIDAITARILGFPGDIIALQTTSMKEDTVKYVRRRYNHVYIGLDNDDSGNAATKEIQKLLQYKDHTVLQYPTECKDINEVFNALGKDDAQRWLEREVNGDFRFKVIDGTSLLTNMIDSMEEIQNPFQIKTGFNFLDYRFGGGLNMEELTLLHAQAKVGKTTVLNQITAFALNAGHKVGIASFEMNLSKELFPRLLSILVQKNIRKDTDFYKRLKTNHLTPEENHGIECLSNVIAYNQHFGNPSLEGVLQFIDECVSKGVKLITIDHSLFLVKDIINTNEHSMVSSRLAAAARRHKIHIILVVQAKNIVKGDQLGLNTMYGGSVVGQLGNNIVTLCRANHEKYPDTLEVRLLKVRNTEARASDEPIYLMYDHETCSLTE